MKALNYIVVTFLCMLAAFIAMTVQRMGLVEKRVRELEDAVHALEADAGTDWRPELRHAF